MIYHDSVFVNPATTSEWFSLSVVNMWDLETKHCCSKNGLLFCLKKNTAINSLQYKSEVVMPDENQKAEIMCMGYKLNPVAQ